MNNYYLTFKSLNSLHEENDVCLHKEHTRNSKF